MKAWRYFRVPHPAALWAYHRTIACHGLEQVGDWRWNLSPYDFARKLVMEAWGISGQELTKQLVAKAEFWRLACLDGEVSAKEAQEVGSHDSTRDLEDSSVVEDWWSAEFDEISSIGSDASVLDEAELETVRKAQSLRLLAELLAEERQAAEWRAADWRAADWRAAEAAAWPPQLHAAETSPPLHEGPFWATLLMGAASAPATLWPERRWPAQLPEAATCPPRTGWTGYFMRARGRGAPSAVD